MTKPLKILIILPLYGGSLPIGHYCVEAFKALGHSVDSFDSPKFLEAHTALRSINMAQDRLMALEQSFVQLLSQAVYSQAEQFKPDLIFAMAQAPLSRSILRKFRQENIKTAMWFVEDHTVFPYWQAFAPLYDHFFIIQKEPFLSKLKEIGVTNAHYLPLAALPNFHCPSDLSLEEKKEFGSDLGFMGAGYPNRRMAFRSLIKYDFKIWGSDWENDSLLANYLQKNGERISPEESVKIYNATRINLNLHSSIHMKELTNGGDFINPRTYELASIGAFQLVDKRTLMDDAFICADLQNPRDDAELATFDSMDSLHENINYYLKNVKLRQQIAENARNRILKEHTYEHRMQAVIDILQKHDAHWPAPMDDIAWPQDISEQMRHEIIRVTQKLGIAPDVPFDTVIHAIKQQNGTLEPTETALLFLSEWQKFYSR